MPSIKPFTVSVELASDAQREVWGDLEDPDSAVVWIEVTVAYDGSTPEDQSFVSNVTELFPDRDANKQSVENALSGANGVMGTVYDTLVEVIKEEADIETDRAELEILATYAISDGVVDALR